MSDDKLQVQFMFEGTILSHGYGFVAQRIMRMKGLDKSAKIIYCYLCSFSGTKMEAWPSVELICDELGMERKTFYKHMKTLKEQGFITSERIKNDQQKFESTKYKIIISEVEIDQIKAKKTAGIPCPIKGDMDKETHVPLNGLWENHVPFNHTMDSHTVDSHDMETTTLKVPSSKVPSLKINNNNDTTINFEFEKSVKLWEQTTANPITRVEEDVIRSWIVDTNYPFELFQEAVDRMLYQGIRKRPISYIDEIFRRWNSAGIKTLQNAKEDDRNDRESNKLKKGQPIKKEIITESSKKYDKFYL